MSTIGTLGIVLIVFSAIFAVGWLVGYLSAEKERRLRDERLMRGHTAHVIESSGGENVRVIPLFDQDREYS